jgi:hypothetical protein
VFTSIPGVFVQLEDTVKSFKAVVDGEYDHLPESAFYMVGGHRSGGREGEADGGRGLMSLSLGLLITTLSVTVAGQPASKPTLDEALLTAMTRGC